MHAPASIPASSSAPIPPAIPLPPLEVQAANLHAAGQSPTQVARSLSVGRATLYRWQQDADFAAYLNQLIRERSSEVTALASHLATQSLRLIQEKLSDPKTPVELQLRLAFRILSLYSRPSFLSHLTSLPDDPNIIAEAQLRHDVKTAGQPPLPELDGSDIALHRAMQAYRLQDAAAFDAAYPDPEAAVPQPPAPASNPHSEIPNLKSQIPNLQSPIPLAHPEISNFKSQIPLPSTPTPPSRDTLRHNETPGAPSPTLASAGTPPRPAAIKPDPLAMRHNETLSAGPCAAAIDAALSGLRQGIAQAA